MSSKTLAKRKNHARALYPFYFLIPTLIIYGVFAIYPTLTNLYYAMTDWAMQKPSITFIGLQQFQRVLQNKQFLSAFLNSAVYGVSITVLKVSLGLAIALALNTKLKTKTLLRSIYFMPIIISTVAVGLLFRSLMEPYHGLLNYLLAAIGVENLPMWITDSKMAIWCCVFEETWRGTGLCMAIFLSGLQSIPRDYYEAAIIDGASAWQRFWTITLPLLRPTLTINIMMSLANGLRGFEPIYYLTGGGPGTASQTVMTLSYKYMAEGLYGYSAAMNFILIFVILILSIPLLRLLNRKEVQL